MGWTYWAYKHWDDPTTADDSQGLFTDDADLSHGQDGQAAPARAHLPAGHRRHPDQVYATTPPPACSR